MSKQKVVVAISGGVDSAFCALLLKKKYELIGIFMRLGVNNDLAENAARKICRKLNIKFYSVNLAEKFKKEVIDYFLNSYSIGLTPNPCIKCNQFIKFGELLKISKDIGAEKVATGHYVELNKNNDFYDLYKGKDENKDQSYFLYNLRQEELKHLLFPLGKYTKKEIMQIAKENNLPHLSRESQDLCFLNGDHRNFLQEKIKLKPGLIKNLQEEVIGEHKGLPMYTIGQRRGIEIGGKGPFYTAKLDYKNNVLYVTDEKEDPVLYSEKIFISELNWISGVIPSMIFECELVLRYRHKPIKCLISKENNKYVINFSKPQRAVVAGQSAVFYKGNQVLGGGIMEYYD